MSAYLHDLNGSSDISTFLKLPLRCDCPANRERKQSGRLFPEADLAELRGQISELVAFAEYPGDEIPSLSMLQGVADPDLMRVGFALDRLQVFRTAS